MHSILRRPLRPRKTPRDAGGEQPGPERALHGPVDGHPVIRTDDAPRSRGGRDLFTGGIVLRANPGRFARTGCRTTAPSPLRRRLSAGHRPRQVERFAGGLYELGVRPGEVVAFRLPDRWETAVLTLACWRVGAVILPISLRLGRREVARTPASTGAVLLVTTDRAPSPGHRA
ncbi:AMP-binding protein [Kitasatospora sp. NPDC094011]|uniref:AMP-binding protein n=1 Tax=Kitasatospora sp. NPDC094011 TaxID=3364090 RepID=UPI003808C72A